MNLSLRLSVLFVFIIPRLTITSSSDDEETKSLYSNDDPILQLSVSDFNQSIYMKNKAFFIEFYSAWCGHCIHFAPLYKEFARSILRYSIPIFNFFTFLTLFGVCGVLCKLEYLDWKDVVEVGAINCALDANLPMCQDQGVEAYPTIKYFKYLSRGPDAGQFYEHSKQTVQDLVVGTAKMVAEDWRKHMPSGWPNLNAMNADLYESNIWRDHSTVEYLAIVLEPVNKSSVAVQVALDFFNDRSKIAVRIVTDKSVLAQTYGIKSFPGLIILKKSNNTPFFVSKSSMTREEMATKIRYHASLGIETKKVDALSNSKAITISSNEQSFDQTRYFVHKVDLVSSISYILYHEIAKFKLISNDKLIDLKQFLETLSRYFPGNDAEKRFLFRLISFLNEIRSEISSEQWKMQLNLLQRQYGNPWSKNVTWISCQGSKSKYRGFPCSLWSLFHVLTVNAYQMDGKKKDFDPSEILKSIKGYIKSFFGCQECSANFEKESEDLQNQVKKPADVVLWLWRIHNKVNERLKGQLSEDPVHPKLQFPPYEICSTCFDSEINSWKDNDILNFLINFYSNVETDRSKWTKSTTIPLDEEDHQDRELDVDDGRFEANPKFKRHRGSKDGLIERSEMLKNHFISADDQDKTNNTSIGGLNNFDFSLCFALWVFSAGALVLLFIFLKFKRTRHKFVKNFYSDYKV